MSNLWSDFLNDRLKPVQTGGVVNGVMDIEESESQLLHERYNETDSDSEDEKYRQENVNNFLKKYSAVNSLTAVDDDEDDENMSVCYETLDVPVAFTKYNFDAYYKKPLPIDSYQSKILGMIQTNVVVIIHGPTGCGKTTQVPQYILNDCKAKNVPCNIVVTQPRRIAALTVAQRVCEERGWAMGTVCGYQVGLDKNIGEDVILTYMTTEVLLQKLIQAKNLTQYTHIIIDEVHERNKTVDFLLLIVRKYLYTNSPNVKVVLMSATMEAKEFSYYFRRYSPNAPNQWFLAPILHVKKKSEYITNIFYNEHISFNVGSVKYDINNPSIELETYQTCVKLIEYFDKIDEINPATNEKNIGSVLVFLPGYYEIEELGKHLQGPKTKFHWEILPIHSSLSRDCFENAFAPPKRGIRKIILSTNIAESSVTVPDVYYVIDFCLTKLININQLTRFASLQLEWASHNNCIQRAGRVGRVSNGRVYRLVPQEFYEIQLSSYAVPELQRAPLENIILYMKLLDLNDTPKNVLSAAMNPPNLKDIEGCIWRLKEVGALLMTCHGEKTQSDGDLTFIGRIMGHLPLDVNLSKLIILGHMFSCLEEAVIMAAGASIRNLFVRTFGDKFGFYNKKTLWSDGSKSDFISLLNLYNVWISKRRSHAFRNYNEEYTWCRMNFVSFRGLVEWELLIKDIHNRLKGFRIETLTGPLKISLDPIEKSVVLKVMICGAFYPNYFIRSSQFGQIDVREAVKILNGRDPFRTVYLTNMKSNQPGHIYVRQIKTILNANNEVSIGFDQDSCKIFVEYPNITKPEAITVNGSKHIATLKQNIPKEVYEAVRKRQVQMPLNLKILPANKAWEFDKEVQDKVVQIDDEEEHCFSVKAYNPLPPLDIEYLTLLVAHVVDPSHFYCHNYNEETSELIRQIFTVLNTRPLQQFEGRIVIDNNKIYAAMYQDKKFYRCKIIALHHESNRKVHVSFIDYGNIQLVPIEHIFHIPNDDLCRIAPIAICCTLSGIKPPVKLNSSAVWPNSIINHFKQNTDSTLVYGKVYSVVGDIVHLELYQSNPDRSSSNISYNQYLINRNLAEPCEESYLSKMDHERRLQVLSSEDPNNTAAYFASHKTKNFIDFDSPEIDDRSTQTTTINLSGPFSPLEMKIHGLMQATTNVGVSIESDSVNVVLLDDNPEDSFARLLVAGNIHQSSTAQRITLSDTTIMPNIPGFPLLMLLLFCPTMEPKVNRDGTKVVSVLCGLGFKNNTRTANYPLHDVAYINDIELNEDLIIKVNKLRYIMNMEIAVMSQIYDELSDIEEIAKHQNNLKEKLFSLLHMKQKLIEQEIVPNYDIWNINECEDLEVIELDVTSDQPCIWPMHWFVRLKDKKPVADAVHTNLEELSRIAKRLDPPKEIVCQMCKSEPLILLKDVRMHIMTKQHKENLQRFSLN